MCPTPPSFNRVLIISNSAAGTNTSAMEHLQPSSLPRAAQPLQIYGWCKPVNFSRFMLISLGFWRMFPFLILHKRFWMAKGTGTHGRAERTVDTNLCSEAKQEPGPGERPWHVKCVQGRVFCLCFVQVIQSKYLEKDMMMLDTRWLRTPHPPILQESVFYSYLLVIMM